MISDDIEYSQHHSNRLEKSWHNLESALFLQSPKEFHPIYEHQNISRGH